MPSVDTTDTIPPGDSRATPCSDRAAPTGRVRVFIACSLDGFIAGPNDELDWLGGGKGAEDTFTPFFVEIGAMLMGRRTYDVVAGFGGEWPYGGTLIRAALDAGLIDEMTITVIPIILGAGIPLFAGAARRHRLELAGQRGIGAGMVELRYRLGRAWSSWTMKQASWPVAGTL